MSNCEHLGKKPNHTHIKEIAPLSPVWKEVVNGSINRMRLILTWKSNRKIWVVWPCSIDFGDSVLEYASRLSGLRDKYRDQIEIVMRFYTGKPRTVWGWKGIQNSQPWEDPNVGEGLINARKLAIEVIENYWLPIADEMLHPQLVKSFDDIYSYLAIGARSTENQYHREVSSSLDMPVGFKNPVAWDLEVVINSLKAWQTPSVYTIWEDIYGWKWNDLSHAILRWSTFEGVRTPNFDTKSLKKIYDYMLKAGVKNPSFIIDTNHDNSWKDPSKQLGIMKKVESNLKNLDVGDCPWILQMWKWFMTESYLNGWNQKISDDIVLWTSLTDPCSSWEDTVKMAKYMAGQKSIRQQKGYTW